ncbi:adenylylsulfate kinase [Haloferax elongans ATCC BAA-1513]|uniref:Adenylylsulfate kinase n=1 Tax=Haloferax elongans ATCC BAA-1513 TaxID=1230453 RepID=M0HBK3_HALEO|nr:adenylyl-sulfate kinase [Haloferax elongans]ELZ81077.1 adenylylsulfate kinase [Haloferax elongans ATCC BAA-1513]
MIIWLIGLSSAGKTTVGRALYEKIKAERNDVLFLDGDHIRQVWGDDLGHTSEERYQNCWRYCRLGALFDEQNIHAVFCILSLFEEHRQWNRENLSSYFEVYVDVPMETLKQRDAKDLYARAESGDVENVVGVDIPFEEPQDPDLILKNDDPPTDPDVLAEQILNELPDEKLSN